MGLRGVAFGPGTGLDPWQVWAGPSRTGVVCDVQRSGRQQQSRGVFLLSLKPPCKIALWLWTREKGAALLEHHTYYTRVVQLLVAEALAGTCY